MTTLLGFAGYLLYIACMRELPFQAFRARMSAFLSAMERYDLLIAMVLPFVLKDMMFLHEATLTLVGLVGYLVYMACMMMMSLLILKIANLLWPPTMRFPLGTFIGMTIIVMDIYRMHSGMSGINATLLLLPCYLVYIACIVALSYLVFNAITAPRRPPMLSAVSKYNNVAPMIMADMSLVVSDKHGVSPIQRPAFISEFLSTLAFSVSDMKSSPHGFLIYMVCMLSLSYMVLIIVVGATFKAWLWWLSMYVDVYLLFTIIVGLTLKLLNMTWGTPFGKPTNDSHMKSIFLGLTGYLIYIVCSVAIHYPALNAMMATFNISLTLVMLNVLRMSFSVSSIISALLGFATSLPPMSFLVVLSFLVAMGICIWVAKLLPSATYNHSKLMFSQVKITLVGLATFINNYRTTYLVMMYVTIIAHSFLPLVRNYVTAYTKYTIVAIIVPLAIMLTMRKMGMHVHHEANGHLCILVQRSFLHLGFGWFPQGFRGNMSGTQDAYE